MSDSNVGIGNTNNVNCEHNNTVTLLKSGEDEQNNVVHCTKDGAETVDRVKFEGLNNKDIICSQESDNDKLPPFPDGGWGWVIVLSAFIISSCVNGLAFSFGLLHEEITLYFQTTQAKTSLVGSLFISVPFLAGPILSALVERFGCRLMTMVASVISAGGFILAAFSNSIEMLCLTFGVISGLGTGILFVTVVISVAYWFEKKRNFAFALSFCGVGFGTLILSPVTEYFLSIYDWRNTIVLLAGILLNMCVCGALMRKPEWLKIKQDRERRLKARSKKLLSAESMSSSSKVREAEELKSLLNSDKSPESILKTLATKQLDDMTQMNGKLRNTQQMHSTIHLPTFVQQKEKVPALVTEKLITNQKLYNIILQNYPDVLTCRHSTVNLNIDHGTVQASNPDKLPGQMKTKKSIETNVNEENNGTFEKERNGINVEIRPNYDNFKAKYIKSTEPYYPKDIQLFRTAMKSTSLPDMNRKSSWSHAKETVTELKWHHHLWIAVKTAFNFKMFTEFHFLVFNLSMLILSVWFIVPFFFLTSYMTDMNVEGGATIMSIIGVSSIIGLVVLGWTGDQPWINVTKIYFICLIICGVSVAACPVFITKFWMLSVVAAIFGFSFAGSLAYTPGILFQLIPLDLMVVAFGLLMMIQGLGHFLGPPIGGFIYDVTGSWELTFYVAGAWIVVSGLCIAVIAYTEDRRICGKDPLLMEVERAKNKSATV